MPQGDYNIKQLEIGTNSILVLHISKRPHGPCLHVISLESCPAPSSAVSIVLLDVKLHVLAVIVVVSYVVTSVL